MKHKHVLILMADHLRYDVVEDYMPNVKQLDGVCFDRCHTASPLCVPARGSFFTGLYPNGTGSIINPWDEKERVHGQVRQGIPNMFGLMENDWDIWHIGKRHFLTEDEVSDKINFTHTDADYNKLLRENEKRPPGGPEYRQVVPEMIFGKVTRARSYSTAKTGCYPEGEEYYFDNYFTKGCIQAIENRDKNKPLFLNAMMLAPHPPFEVPEPWYSHIKNPPKLPKNVGKRYPGQSPLQLYNLPGIIGSRYSLEEWREPWRVYLGLVAMLDDCIGKIIAKLKQENMYDDTLIIITSDHGEMLGAHSMFQKMCLYEESLITPLVIKFPADYSPACKFVGDNVSAVDVMPTVLDYFGLDTPDGVSGCSLMPAVEGGGFKERDIFAQFDGNGSRGNFQRCIISGEHKLIMDIFKDEIFIELYNVKTDRLETENLALKEENAYMVRELIGRLSAHMKRTGDLLSLPADVYETFMANATYL